MEAVTGRIRAGVGQGNPRGAAVLRTTESNRQFATHRIVRGHPSNARQHQREDAEPTVTNEKMLHECKQEKPSKEGQVDENKNR